MAIEKKTGLFYEILIRGYAGGEHLQGLELGQFAGAHYIEGTAIVDDDGTVVSYTPGPAQELPADKVAAYLGEKFTAFEAQQRALQLQFNAQQGALQAQLEEAQKQIAGLAAANAALQAKIDNAHTALAAST